MLRLYHSPLACSLASRLALAESGLAHEIVFINTRKGEQNAEAYRRINPRGKVPALETGEGVVTESSAILPLIADLAPEKRLLPPAGTIARAKAQSWLAHLSGTLHPALSASMFPERFAGCDPGAIRAHHLAVATGLLKDIDGHLSGQGALLGEFSVADLLLSVFSLWRRGPGLAGALPDLPHLDAFTQLILARPLVGPIVGEEMKRIAEAAA
jgi:glutathione S-transferase